MYSNPWGCVIPNELALDNFYRHQQMRMELPVVKSIDQCAITHYGTGIPRQDSAGLIGKPT